MAEEKYTSTSEEEKCTSTSEAEKLLIRWGHGINSKNISLASLPPSTKLSSLVLHNPDLHGHLCSM